jgi:ribonuclease E
MAHDEGQAEPIQDAAQPDAAHVDAAGSNGEDDNAPGGETQGDGDRRRRRRGRRGGRRNRRDREAGVPPSSDGAPMEADVQADAEAETSEPERAFEHEAEPQQPFHPHAAEQVAEAPQRETRAPEPAPVEAGHSEAARRRSTVREPAPISVGREHSATHEPAASPSAPPQPVDVSPTEGDDSDRPRRSGWWSRRVLGKD